MIKIHRKDSIIDIIIKINNCKEKEIVLDFPFSHPIIHSYTSLKILKNKFQKELSLKLKKIYPLSVCEIRMLEVTKFN